jgi:hypothetical protein
MEASRALELARTSLTSGRDAEARENARAEAERALILAPDWVAPRRFLDELDRGDLLLPERLAEYQEALARKPDDAATLYLYGRLLGTHSGAAFHDALGLDSSLAWAWHGLAVHATREGDTAAALRYQRMSALAARDPWEAAFFDLALARRLAEETDLEGATKILTERLKSHAFTADIAPELEGELALIELGNTDDAIEARGFERALSVVADPRTDVVMLARLAERLASAEGWGLPATTVELVYAMRNEPMTSRLRADFLREDTSLETLDALRGEYRPDRRADPFARGRAKEAIESWVQGLPRVVLDSSGVPNDPRLSALVRLARSLPKNGMFPIASEERVQFGNALIAAGWFEEARALALSWLPTDDALARNLEVRALAGLAVLDTLRTLMREIDRGRAQSVEVRPGKGEEGPEFTARPLESVDDLLRALVPAFTRAHQVLGGDTDPAEVERELLSSPRIGYGPLATIVHPGPWFSAEDESLGRGREGARVGGLAAEFQSLGRFGVLGEVLFGGGPDAAVLRTLAIQTREGVHLGQPWRGTIAYCDSADVQSRFERRGAGIAGASVHEGYWVDVQAARENLRAWEELRARFSGKEQAAAVQHVLQLRGPRRIGTPQHSGELDPLGEDERVVLAILADRRTEETSLGTITLDELVEVLALHEEGHLCDRARFYPLAGHMWRILGLLARAGFEPAGIARRLEYRAELVALCEAPEPRLVLAGILHVGGNGESASPTEHSSAYRELLDDLIVELDRAMAADPADFEGIEPDRELLYQLHSIAPETLRKAAREAARREGLFTAEAP